MAEQAGLQSRGQIGQLQGHYLLCSKGGAAASVWGSGHGEALAAHPDVLWHSQEKVLSRSKRSLAFNDPSYPKQWHLVRIYPHPTLRHLIILRPFKNSCIICKLYFVHLY